jgi:[acyl-carrier-protein] S-malonyltransferase
MTPSITIRCPGQGAQAVGMAKEFFDASPAAKETFEQANQILGFDLTEICFSGPEDRLNQTDISQPAIYTASVASFRAAEKSGKINPAAVGVYAGLSLGEYTALHLGGAFDFEQGLKLVAARGRYMQAAAIASPSGMVALIGADADIVQKLCTEAAQGQVLVPANYNAPGQIVASGDRDACQRLLSAAESAGFKAVALKVAGAFHSPLMQPAADKMRDELNQVEFRPLQKTVYSNVTAQPHGDSSSIKDRLVDQIVKPVLWEQTMQTLIAAGEPKFIELSPGRTLAGLAKRINRRLPVESVSL